MSAHPVTVGATWENAAVPGHHRGPFRDMPAEVAILTSVSFTVALGFGIVAPDIPAFARHFGVSTASAASVVSAFALLRVLGALPAGRLVDRFGERRVMAAGIAVVAASSILAGISGSFAELIVLRGIGGLGSAMFSVSAQTLLLLSVPADQRGRASGLFSGGFLVGSISGPAIGGLLAAWSLRAPFFVYGGMLVVPAVIAAAVLRDPARREPGRAGPRAASPFAGIGRALRSRAFRAAASANLADGFAAVGVRSAIVPLFVRDALHRSAVWTGIGFLVVAVLNGAALLPAGWAADRLGRRPVIVAGCSVSAAGLVMLAVLPGLWGYLTAVAVLGLGSGLLDVAPAAMIGDLLGGQGGQGGLGGQGGTVVATYQMAGDAGTVAGPVTAGYLVDTVSYGAAFGLAAGVLGVAAVLGFFAPETRSPAPAAVPGPPIPAGIEARGRE
jgi:DHA1 family multidrug resistance protein-like MFS transporter